MSSTNSKLLQLGLEPAGSTEFMPLDDQELQLIESRLEVQLPATFREFLQTFGASGFRGIARITARERLPPSVSETGHVALVGDFYGSVKSGPARSLLHQIDNMRSRMPAALIPIARAGMGDNICIGITDDHVGRIYYWFHEDEPLTPEEYLEDYGVEMPPAEWFRNVTLVADSFDDMVDRTVVTHE